MLSRLAPVAGELGSALRRISSFSSLPIIDIAPLTNPEASISSATSQVAIQLDDACRNVGFFYVKGHGMAPELVSGVLEYAQQWFALPEEVKRHILLTPAAGYRGWQPLGANVTRFDGGWQRDWHEAIDLFKEEDPAAVAAAGRPASPLHGANQWPNQLPAFEPLLRSYLDEARRVAASILRGIALGLRLPEAFFEHPERASREGSYWVARVLHYPPLAQGSQHAAGGAGVLAPGAAQAAGCGEAPRETQLSCGEHTDYGLLTLVNQQPGVTALQVRNAAGRWVDAPPLEGTFVVNIGDMAATWTNGLYQPTLHRVVNADHKRARTSLAFFFEPCFEARVAPLPQFGAPRYAPVRYGSHLESKVLSNFELEDVAGLAAAGDSGGVNTALV